MKTNNTILNNKSPLLPSPEAVITIEHIAKSFGEQIVLKDISLKLYKGENLVVLGKSGSGKSVLIKCIVGLLYPDKGTVNVLGEDIESLDDAGLRTIRRQVGFLFQSGALYDSMTVKENLLFPLKIIKKGLTNEEMEQKVNEVLESVGLGDAGNKMPSQLSGGMRKRISLARTIVVDPLIILYDEPTTGLDPVTSDEISALINEVQLHYKTSSIIITHDIKCARCTSDRIIMIQEGEVYMEGDLDSFEKSTDPLIVSFFH